MRVLQITNLVSHHQLPLARELAAALGPEHFRFAATDGADAARVKLGWARDATDPWILRVSESEQDRDTFEKWWATADVVVCGARLVRRMASRLRDGRLTFYMSERWWKPPLRSARLLHPRFAWMAVQIHKMASAAEFHHLAIGDGAARDLAWIAPCPGRTWRWGYFTEVSSGVHPVRPESAGLRVLWAGRMLGWKRVDTIVRGFERLVRDAPTSVLTLVGDGPERTRIERLARELLPRHAWRLLPAVPVVEVLAMMRQHDVYVLASDAAEGWGAVANEAMSEGCVVVGSDAAGATHTLIRHEENGLLFEVGDSRRLGELLSQLSREPERARRLARRGRETVSGIWSPSNAGDRLLAVSEAILTRRTAPIYCEGPMSQVTGGCHSGTSET